MIFCCALTKPRAFHEACLSGILPAEEAEQSCYERMRPSLSLTDKGIEFTGKPQN